MCLWEYCLSSREIFTNYKVYTNKCTLLLKRQLTVFLLSFNNKLYTERQKSLQSVRNIITVIIIVITIIITVVILIFTVGYILFVVRLQYLFYECQSSFLHTSHIWSMIKLKHLIYLSKLRLLGYVVYDINYSKMITPLVLYVFNSLNEYQCVDSSFS